ncbi:MAG: asparaginase domain-containing protein [Acidobacteriota bacterium]|nr:asparaginase domain-containing protein [Acidobacteriota bacterium]
MCFDLVQGTPRGKIKIFTAGGSIDKTYDLHASDFLIGPSQVGDVLREANVTIPFEVEEFVRKDSLQMTDEDREQLRQLVAGEPAERIVITHGTDTLHLTGQALSEIPGKVIVLTAAMRPASFKDTDAHFNIGCAFIAAQTLPEGVYLVINGRVFDPFRANKNTQSRCFDDAP